jgi:hypothetical protein
MFSRREILDAGPRGKAARQFYRLTTEAEVAFEHRGPYDFGEGPSWALSRAIGIGFVPPGPLRRLGRVMMRRTGFGFRMVGR